MKMKNEYINEAGGIIRQYYGLPKDYTNIGDLEIMHQKLVSLYFFLSVEYNEYFAMYVSAENAKNNTINNYKLEIKNSGKTVAESEMLARQKSKQQIDKYDELFIIVESYKRILSAIKLVSESIKQRISNIKHEKNNV